jgi:pimeloyl-ACP methyl ester carboxylesterase
MFKYLYSRLGYFIALLLFVNVCGIGQTTLKDEMRFPWATATGGFIQDWLIIGGFPNQDGKGFDNDYLQEHDGELKIQPVPGMTHKLLNGSTFEWKKYHSPYNYINFFDVLENVEYSTKVGYAYTKVQRPADGKVILSFGHNVSNKLWLNGKLVYESRTDNQPEENNHIEVEMAKGDNSILIKSVHGGWTWGFTFRIIEPKNFSLIHDSKLSPEILKPGIKDNLIVKTDRSLNPEIQKFDVNVKVVAPGGNVVSEKTVKRGEKITFDSKKWRDGVYDICFKSNNIRGEVETAYLYWYKGNAVQKAKELLASVPKNPASPNDYHHVMLSQMVIERFGFNPEKVDSTKLSDLYSPLMEYEELKLTIDGKKGSVRANGFVRLTYIDEIDHTPQFCRAYLPLNYTPNKKYPLVVMLHGYFGDNPVYVKWWSIDQRHYSVVDKYPVIYIEPHGRGNTSYNGIGDRDVLRCIELAKQTFNVDEDRVYLKGESMGGGGTWNVGTRHPELFAAIAPVYGAWDYHVSMDENQLAKLTESERFNYEKSSSFVHADALLTTPVFVIHGDIDKSVNVNNSRYAVRLLQRWGYDIRYHEYPGFGHEGIPYTDQLIQWFLEHKRNSHPDKVRVRSADLRSASAHWLKVTQRNDPNSFIEAEAEVLLNNTIKLSTENVLEVELTPSNELIDPQKPVTVIWNVNDIRETSVANGKILVKDKSYNPSFVYKTPNTEGNITEIITSPFAVVIGTISNDSLMIKMINKKSQEFITYWKNWQKYNPRIYKDTELTDAEMSKYSLMLFGDAEANLITKKLSNKIPLKISSQEIEITGRTFAAKDACVQMIYPHPNNPERHILVIGATSGEGMFFCNQSNLNCDFIIQDGLIPNKPGMKREIFNIASGIFDYNWQIKNEFLITGDSTLRKNCPIRRVLPDLTTRIDNLPVIDSHIFESYKGKYEIQPGVIIDVYTDSGKLMVKTPEGARIQLLPLSDSEYFIEVADIQITFGKIENGKVDKLTVHQNGRDSDAKKIE